MNAIFGNKQVSKREYDIVVHRNEFIAMGDAVNICVVFRPISTGQFPALVALSPFNKDILLAETFVDPE